MEGRTVDESGFVFVFTDARSGPEIMLCKLDHGIPCFFHWNYRHSEWGVIPCELNVDESSISEALKTCLPYEAALPFQMCNPTFKPKI